MRKTISPNNDNPETQAIVAELEKRAYANIDAMNKRDFSTTSALFYLKTDDWVAQAAHGLEMRDMHLKEYVEALSKMAKENPDFKARLVDATTTVNAKMDYAQMYMNVEIEGMPPGIVRQTVAIVVYRLVDGVWMACSHRGMAGMDGGASM